jgi:hypothetical protein
MHKARSVFAAGRFVLAWFWGLPLLRGNELSLTRRAGKAKVKVTPSRDGLCLHGKSPPKVILIIIRPLFIAVKLIPFEDGADSSPYAILPLHAYAN